MEKRREKFDIQVWNLKERSKLEVHMWDAQGIDGKCDLGWR